MTKRNDDNDDDDTAAFDLNLSELQSRIERLRRNDEQQSQMTDVGTAVSSCPVICMDALLPAQRMEGSTSDPTFGVFLRDLSIGGVFVMTSLDTKTSETATGCDRL